MNETIKKIAPIVIVFLIIVLSTVLYRRYAKYTHTKIKKIKILSHNIKHLGIIMDGNRRWACEQNKPSWFGHQNGAQNAKMAVRFCVDQKIPYLTLYSFSTENFKRSKEELSHIFGIIVKGLNDKEIKNLVGNGVKIKFIGERSLFPENVKQAAEKIESTTKNGKGLTVNLLFAYGGRMEITSAIKSICKEVQNKKINVEDITEKLVENYLWTSGCPDPDLIIRTGKRNRLSNFLAWQNVYSELMFLDKHWPAITKNDLNLALNHFEKRNRTYGK